MTLHRNIAAWTRRQWVMAVSLVLCVTLTPLGWIQWQQVRMLENVSRHQFESMMWQAYQLGYELQRLGESLRRASEPGSGPDADELLERYDVFYSRIQLITDMPRRDLLESSPVFMQTLEQVRAFVAMADPHFEDPQALLDDATTLRSLQGAARALQPRVHALTQEANRAVARFVDERDQQLRDQGALVLLLSGLQAIFLGILLALLVGHVRRQKQENRTLLEFSQALGKARDDAEAANRGKSMFLANMSHEIRTPFQGLLGMLNLLDDSCLNPQQKDHLKTARNSALHLLGVLNDILDVSTMESGTLKLSPAPTHLRHLVQEVEGLMQVPARDKGLTLLVSASSDLPAWVLADATRLRQILFNLLSNAIKFTSAGSVIAEVRRQRDNPDGIVFRVRDSGIGMDEATVRKLFTRFYQADDSLRRRVGGTGLGLEISRNLARMMGGDITVQSKPGVGSIFTVALTLPTCAAPRGSASLAGRSPSHRRLKMLVAEDHPINLKYMSILLERMGHEAVFCENGQEALERVQQQPFDVVLLDYHMPVLDGLATTQAIRSLKGPESQIKIVLVTADVVNDTRKRAIEAGVNEFTSKPLQAQDLQLALLHCGLLESGDAPTSAGTVQPFQHSTPFPVLASEVPVRVIDDRAPDAAIDFESYREVAGLLPQDTLGELLGTLFDAPEGSVPALLTDLAQADANTIAYSAHKLKGTAMLLGFRGMARTAAVIEGLAQKGQRHEAGLLADQLQRDSEATRRALQQHAGQRSP